MELPNLVFLPASFIGIAFIGNVLLLIVNLLIFFSALTKSRRVSKRYEQIEDEYAKMIQAGNQSAAQILKQAGSKSEELIASVKVNTETIKNEIRHSFIQAVSAHTVEAGQSIAQINQDYKAFLGKLQTDLKSDTAGMVQLVMGNTRSEIQNFIGALKRDTLATQQKFGQEVAKEFNSAIEQIKAYRQDQLSLVERSINKIVIKVAKAVLAEVISITEHERLIFDALERAKKEEVFEELFKVEMTAVKNTGPERSSNGKP